MTSSQKPRGSRPSRSTTAPRPLTDDQLSLVTGGAARVYFKSGGYPDYGYAHDSASPSEVFLIEGHTDACG